MRRMYPLSWVTALMLLAGVIWLTWAKPLSAAPLAQTGDPVFVGAGDIAACGEPNDSLTANLLDGIAGTVFTLGDNAYESGTINEYDNCYEPTWGRHRARTKPVPGNHEYNSAGAAGYYTYFGVAASPLESNCSSNCQGYYSYDLGAWHIVALNSELTGPAAATQLTWLRDDLAAHPTTCTLAYWHRPFYTSGPHQTDAEIPRLKPYWEALYHYGADLVLNGHDHNYERFALQNANGQADPTRGIREFVVGTGGRSLRALATILPNSEVRNSDTHGVLKLTLHATSYDWLFIPIAGQTFTDSGTANCVTASAAIPAPVGYWRMESLIEGLTLNSATGQYDAQNAGNGGVGFENDPPDNNVGWNSAERAAPNRTTANFSAANSYLEIASNTAYSLSNEVTLAAWVKLANPTTDQKIVGKLWLDFPNGAIIGSGYLLGVEEGQIKAEVYDANQAKIEAKGGAIAANTWTHVAVTWKTSGQLISYINGVPVATTPASASPIGNKCEVGKGGCNVIIGRAPWDPSIHKVDGNIDEVMIFKQALTADAIAQLAQRTFIVASNDNSLTNCAGNACTLKTAIADANAAPNGMLRDRIHFNLPTPALIQPDAELPRITDPLIIDGMTQPGASCSTWPPTLKVALDGSNAGNANGLDIRSDHVTVRGLNVRNFSRSGILIQEASDGLIECNLIGSDLAGATVASNPIGVAMVSFGPATKQNRVVRNLISGHTSAGIVVQNASENVMEGNYIGTNLSGTVALNNGGVGIAVTAGSTQNRVGGPTAQERNLIAGNKVAGIYVAEANANLLQGNFIGTDVSGALALGNQGSGVLIVNAANNTIGGKATGNRIAFNLDKGVWISGTTATGNFIAENLIHHNTGLGIDLGVAGVATNDLGDGDSDANHLQNYPVLTSVVSSGGATTVNGTLNSLANTRFLIEFYTTASNAACQGETFIGFAFVTTDASGNTPINATLATGVPGGKKMTATASAIGTDQAPSTFDTSEFSACLPVTVIAPASPDVRLTPFQSSVNEGASRATLTVRLSISTSVPITVNYSTGIASGPESATAGSDYTAVSNQSVIVPVGKISATLAISILNDLLVESSERFPVNITLPANSIATLDDTQSAAVVTILDNDGANNTPPVATPQTVNAVTGTAQPITLRAADVDNNLLTYTVVTQPPNGSLSGTAPNLLYTANAGFIGTDTFTFKVNDGAADSPVVTVSIIVAGTNPIPSNSKVYLPTVRK